MIGFIRKVKYFYSFWTIPQVFNFFPPEFRYSAFNFIIFLTIIFCKLVSLSFIPHSAFRRGIPRNTAGIPLFRITLYHIFHHYILQACILILHFEFHVPLQNTAGILLFCISLYHYILSLSSARLYPNPSFRIPQSAAELRRNSSIPHSAYFQSSTIE